MKGIEKLIHGAARKRAGLALVAALFGLVLSTPCWALDWAMTYGTSGDDKANSLQQTVDGLGNPDGYVVAGSSASFGGVWVLKLNLDGSVAWEKAYGSSGDSAQAIQQTAEGGYVVAGAMNSEAAVLKLGADGSVAWSKGYGGKPLNAVRQTVDGLGNPDGYIVAGSTDTSGAGGLDFWVLRLNLDGTVAWQNTYGYTSDEEARSIQQTADGGYIVAGSRTRDPQWYGDPSCAMWVMKLNPDGTVAWHRTFTDSTDSDAYCIQQTADGGYIVAGEAGGPGILKLNGDGTVAWSKSPAGLCKGARYIGQTADGGYLVTGAASNPYGDSNVFMLLKLDSTGVPTLQKTYGLGSSYICQSATETADGFVMAGYTDSSAGAGGYDACVFKVDAEGQLPSCNPLVDSFDYSWWDDEPGVQNPPTASQASSAAATDLGAAARSTAAATADVCSGLPLAVTNPSPALGATGVATSTVLSWTCTNPNPGDTVTYNLHLWVNLHGGLDPKRVDIRGLTEPTYAPPRSLRCSSEYLWYVTAKTSSGAKFTGPWWKFTTTDEGCPVIDSLSPWPCYTREVLSILGRNFGATKGVIRIGADIYRPDDPKILSWTDTQIDFRIKQYNGLCFSYRGAYWVWVKAGPPDNRIKSNMAMIDIYKDNVTSPAYCPRIDVVYPGEAVPREEIILLGLNFGNKKGVIVLQEVIGQKCDIEGDCVPIWGFLTKYSPYSLKIKEWTDDEIRFRLKAFSDWPSGTTKKCRIKLKVGPPGARLRTIGGTFKVTVP